MNSKQDPIQQPQQRIKPTSDQLIEQVAQNVSILMKDPDWPRFFTIWEARGFHITPNHFYQPIPDTRAMPDVIWEAPSSLPGIDTNEAGQIQLLEKVFPKFREEYEQLPLESTGNILDFYLCNGSFEGHDALVSYCMIRHLQPTQIIECGSGYSSLLTLRALEQNESGKLICVEPYPKPFLQGDLPSAVELIQAKLEDLPIDFFIRLAAGDVLFIDTSHVVRTGGDVNRLFL